MSDTILLVFLADRGHFSVCIPLARALKRLGFRCELWTNELSIPWLPEGVMDAICTQEFGDGADFFRFISGYKRTASKGDSDADGRENCCANGFKGMIELATEIGLSPEVLADIHGLAAPQKGRDAFRIRLDDADVAAVAWEGVWGNWVPAMAKEASKPELGIMPSYLRPFRATSDVPIWEFDQECRVRNQNQDMDEWSPDFDVSFVIAKCLCANVPPPTGRNCLGPFLPADGDTTPLDSSLSKWLAGDDLPEDKRTVVLIALGSVSVLDTLSTWAAADLIRGCLKACPRVLFAASSAPDDSDLKTAVAEGRLRVESPLPQWAALGHISVKCFVSHCGANSTHEALAQGKPIVPLPFFDDQYYIAERVEELYAYSEFPAYSPLRKALFRAGPAGDAEVLRKVATAVTAALNVPQERLSILQQEVIAENGAGAGAERLRAKVLEKRGNVEMQAATE